MTRELADTSAWTNRRKDPAVSRDFENRLLAGDLATCPMVKLELLWESQHVNAFRRRRDQLDALDEIPIDAAVWRRATEIFERLAARGPLHHRQVKLPDLLVAAAAENAGVPVCHYDRDFDVIAQVTGQQVRAIAPLGSL
ncbi:MAG TPA: PIN domain-containing protein [Gaiellaceae bacterium]